MLETFGTILYLRRHLDSTMISAWILVLLTLGHVATGDVTQQQALSAAESSFSQKLYKNVALQQSNIVYSPYSIHSVLTMTSLGARGNTATEMINVLELGSIASPHQTYHDLIVEWNSVTGVVLNTCNAIFSDPLEMILPSFTNQVTGYYLATARNLDLAEPEKAINSLVANKTNGVISEVLKPGSLDPSNVLVLVNVIFFNGTWENPFHDYSTQKQDFHQLGGVVTKVDMLKDFGHHARYKNDDALGVDVVELFFKGNQFSFYIALPQKVDGIKDLENQLTAPGKVDLLFQGLQSGTVDLSVPKFKIETSLDLEQTLITMGMASAFNSRADFSGINGVGSLQIDKVIHKAVIEVQETGTVAAAATVVSITKELIMIPDAVIVADHPFLFFIRDNKNNAILFQGKFSG
ncbi:unnamed protein product [Lymnaea stagnalis]|uniref:Serpin domain-containing protein n=1 Tax=Lymnaea stagnalis TaxID=6523 RepID=A0AAV2HMD9_LYMST